MLGAPSRSALPLQTHPEHPLWGPVRQQRAQAPEPWGGPAAGMLVWKSKGGSSGRLDKGIEGDSVFCSASPNPLPTNAMAGGCFSAWSQGRSAQGSGLRFCCCRLVAPAAARDATSSESARFRVLADHRGVAVFPCLPSRLNMT